ncbi:N-acetylmuramoyl-L-alanine amidase [Janibacter sp. GS2]|uniref:N-acetylmuramoyl-L-alanine amidase n=1 Tax=Janibacter sp. GS2 TaxID=3442646 RepID=UPI003EB9CC40
MLVAGAVVPALVMGPTVTLSAQGDDPEPVDTSMQTVPVAGISTEAATDTRNVAYNAPPAAEHSQVSAVLTESPHDEVEPDDDDLVALTKKQSTEKFSALGVTWESEQEPVEVWVRTKTAATTWSNWEYVPSSQDHAPDPGTSEAAGQARAGTDPLMVPESDGVQVRVEAKDGSAPTGMKVNLIDPKQAGQDAELDQQVVPPGNATAAATQPEIITRAQWGADESLRRQDPQYGTVRGGFVHHTASTNTYTSEQVAAQLRSIYTYHVQGRGWNDIGYNYLVDKYGRIFEGRYGGVDKAVVGAHTGGYNSQSFAMSALGDYQNGGQPTAAMVDSYAKLYAWKLGQHEVDATSSVTIYGRQFDAISGHRNAMSTSCPGDSLYAQLPKIRQAAHVLQGSSAPAPTTPPVTEAPAPPPVSKPTPKPNPTPTPTTKPSSPATVKHTLRRGSPYRDEVRLLQRKLGITADGVFGSGTEAAVKRYQRSKRLGADGIAGPNTLRAMGLYGTASTPVTKPVPPQAEADRQAQADDEAVLIGTGEAHPAPRQPLP